MKSVRKILTVAIALVAIQANAQKISGGIEAGVSTGSVKITEIPNSGASAIKGNNIMGYEAGFFLKLGLGPFYVKPELLLNHRAGEVNIESETNTMQTVDFKVNRFEVPVMFGLELLGPVTLEAGPVYNKILNVTESFNNDNVSIKQDGLGYRIGAVVGLGRIGVGVHYQGLKINSSDSNVSNFSLPSELIFSLGLSLVK